MLTSKTKNKYLKKIASFLVVFSFLGLFIFNTTTHAGVDLCPNMSGEQALVPTGFILINGNCVVDTNATNYVNNPNNGTPNNSKFYTEGVDDLLAPLPGLEDFAFDEPCPLGRYVELVMNLIIGLVAVIAMVKIVMGGIQYMTSELISSKAAGKESIMNAIFGLLIALTAFLILNTLNPNLLNICLDNFPKARISIDKEILDRAAGLGQCQEAKSSSPCSTTNLKTAFGDKAQQASSICQGESGGNQYSGSIDKAIDGKTDFSIGLFQVNIIAHGNQIGDGQICKNIFKIEKDPVGKVGSSSLDGSLGGCLERIPHAGQSICVRRAATIISQDKYNKCKAYLEVPANNIAYAVKLEKSSGWSPWLISKNRCGF